MAILGNISTLTINGNSLSIKDNALTQLVNSLIDTISDNNIAFVDRINDLNNRSFDNVINVVSNDSSELNNIRDGLYKVQYANMIQVRMLDILWSDNKVTSNIRSISDGVIPIGLCVIPTGFLGANTPARFMALKYPVNANNDPSTVGASASTTFGWDNNKLKWSASYTDITDLTNYATVDGNNSFGQIGDPNGDFIGGGCGCGAEAILLYTQAGTWYGLESNTPFNGGSLGDIAGKENTAIISSLNNLSNYPAFKACLQYTTRGTQAGDWYLPSVGELALVCSNQSNINTKLREISSIYSNDCMLALHNDSVYLSSNEYNSDNAYSVYFGNGSVELGGKYLGYVVLPMIQQSILSYGCGCGNSGCSTCGCGSEENITNYGILIQEGNNQYLYKDGKVSNRIKIDNVWYNDLKDYYSKQYLTIVSLEDDNTIGWKASNNNLLKTISISTDGGATWVEKTSSTSGTTLATLNAGYKLLVKGSNIAYGTASYYNYFTSTGNFNIEGNIMSLIYSDNFIQQNTLDSSGSNFYNLFKNCNKLISTEHFVLSVTTLANYCYRSMFEGCTSLVNAPELPATTLFMSCYSGMFNGCTSLVNAPELPAITLAISCYSGMFAECTSLVNAPKLPATTLANYCYQYMFSECTSLLNAPELPATILGNYCYQYMFKNCTSLVNAPELPATILTESCYLYMFKGCTSLVNTPELPVTTLANYCYTGMFNGCTSLVNAHELPATILTEGCYDDMFAGCTSLVNAPELSATILADYCYREMFTGCTSLKYIKCLATDISATDCVSYWVDNVAAKGTFIKNDNMSSWTTGVRGIPSGWNIYKKSESNLVHRYEVSPINLTTSINILKLEKINNNSINKLLIPIDSSKNIYNGDNISNSIIIPYISNNENYLLLQLGNIIKENSIILEANLTGIGFYCNPNILYNNGNMQIYSTLPLNVIKDNLQYLIVTYYNAVKQYLYLWIDDFPEDTIEDIFADYGGDNWEDYVTNYLLDTSNNAGESLYNGATGYQYTGETFDWNNQRYYLWEGFKDINEPVKYILTETIDYNELYNHSLEADISNTWCPYIIKFNPDYLLADENNFYDEATGDILVTVSNNPQDLWIKQLNFTGEEHYNDWDDYVENYLLNENNNYGNSNEYEYIGEILEWEGAEYYIWRNNTRSYYILTDTIDFQTLYNKSIEANHYNMICPYVAMLHNDYSLMYNASERQDDWLIKVVADSNDNTQAQYIYIDDFNIGG